MSDSPLTDPPSPADPTPRIDSPRPRGKSRLKMQKARLAGLYQQGTILYGMVAVAIFGIAAKAVGAVMEGAVAWRFGTDRIVDAYIFAFNLLTMPVTIWYSAIFAVVVPLFVRLPKEVPKEAKTFRREFSERLLFCRSP